MLIVGSDYAPTEPMLMAAPVPPAAPAPDPWPVDPYRQPVQPVVPVVPPGRAYRWYNPRSWHRGYQAGCATAAGLTLLGALCVGGGLASGRLSINAGGGENYPPIVNTNTPTTSSASGQPNPTCDNGVQQGPYNGNDFTVNTQGDAGAVVSEWNPQGGPFGTAEITTTVGPNQTITFQGRGTAWVYGPGCTSSTVTAAEAKYDQVRPAHTSNWHGHVALSTLEADGIAQDPAAQIPTRDFRAADRLSSVIAARRAYRQAGAVKRLFMPKPL